MKETNSRYVSGHSNNILHVMFKDNKNPLLPGWTNFSALQSLFSKCSPFPPWFSSLKKKITSDTLLTWTKKGTNTTQTHHNTIPTGLQDDSNLKWHLRPLLWLFKQTGLCHLTLFILCSLVCLLMMIWWCRFWFGSTWSGSEWSSLAQSGLALHTVI